MKLFAVTTSWDDGHKLDLRVARLLKKYSLKGTFYIAPRNREFDKNDLLTEKQVFNLSRDFEIGAHTMTHPLLANDFQTLFFKVVTKVVRLFEGKSYTLKSGIGLSEAEKEIKDSKRYLEKIIGKKVISFCYPAGSQNKKIQEIVKKSGFKYARTVERHKFVNGANMFAVPTSLHAYRQYQDVFRILRFSNWKLNDFWENMDWEVLAKRMFDQMKPDEVFHFWGHSWIIDERNEWEKLERVFEYISGKQNVKYLTNGDFVK